MGKGIESAENDLIDKLFSKYGMSVVYEGGYSGFKGECDFLCSIHGKFKATPRSVLRNELGCRKCGLSKMSMTRSSLGMKFDGAVSDLDARLFEDLSRYSKIKGLWSDMLQRCYGNATKLKSYTDCHVSKDWMRCSKFYEDIRGYENYEMIHNGWQLDKDVLYKGNKLYSKGTCCIVPHTINTLFSGRPCSDKELPVGVFRYNDQDKYRSQIQIDNTSVHLGVFDNVESAFYAYKLAKEDHLTTLANKHKEYIPSIVYNTIVNYKVEITD